MTDSKHETKKTASTHTPGPWLAEVNDLDLASVIMPDGHQLYVGGENQHLDTIDANARLIAASPRMLSALEQVVAWAEPESGNFTAEEIEWLAEAQAAVAEAKGLAV